MFLVNFQLDFAAKVSRNLITRNEFVLPSDIHYIKDAVLMEKLNKTVEGTELVEVHFIFFSLSNGTFKRSHN